MDWVVAPLPEPGPESGPVEIVERKGLGHPDSLCDALAEELSLGLSRLYRERFGLVLHHNVDKALLWAGRAEPRFGGGQVLEPMEIFLAGRATLELRGTRVDVGALAEETSRRWLSGHLPALDPERHVRIRCLVRPGATELVELFQRAHARGVRLANDTSCGVGFAPLSPLERAVLAAERRLNSAETRHRHPELGEDVKVMGLRRDDRIHLCVACALVDRHLPDAAAYAAAKQCAAALAGDAARESGALPVEVEVNAADDEARGSVFLTVTGTSAEAGDDGEAGRGNRVNGLITPGRPMTMESVAGKNPITHVGKLYNLAASLIAQTLVETLPLEGAECRLVSRIGSPVGEPQLAEVRARPRRGEALAPLVPRVREVVGDMLQALDRLVDELLDGRLALDRWPLRGES